MAELLLASAIIFGIFSFIFFVAAITPPHASCDGIIAKVSSSVFVLCLAALIWTSSAMSNYNPTPTVLERPIEELRNVPFYFDENNKPVEIKGDGRFADPKTTVVLLKTFPGGWKYGLYVSERRGVEFAKKSEVEK